MSAERYKSGAHLPRVKKSSGVRLGPYVVLGALCDRSEYDRPEVTITKAQIHEITGLCDKTIKKSLQSLRKTGVIVPIRGFEGGRGVATTYRLVDIGQGGHVQDKAEGQGRKVPPALFSRWCDKHGYGEARRRQQYYEAGIDVPED